MSSTTTAGRPAAPPAAQINRRRSRAEIGSHLVWVLLLAATIPWRKNVYYDGGADAVVVGKAALSLLALGLAAYLARDRLRRLAVPAAPVLLLVAYLSVTVIGGYASEQLSAALVLAARVAILASVVVLLYARFSGRVVLGSLVRVLAVITTVAALSGLPSAASGRLQGAIPPLNPNELALMASVCLLWTFAKMVRAQETAFDLVCLAGCVGVVLLTGSRASLAALCVAIVAMALKATAFTPRSFGLTALLAPALAYVAVGTDLLSSVFLRGGERGVTTLSNRTIAWDAALTSDRDPWQTWFGAGLSQKKISVPGQWWNTQLLDSSWISALVQGGLIGMALVLAMVLTTLLCAALAPRTAQGALWLGLVVLLAGRAFLESGLFDSTTAFALFMVVAFGCRQRPEEESDARPLPAHERGAARLVRA